MKRVLVVVVSGGLIPASVAAADECRDVLKHGIFDKTMYENNTAIRSYLDQWFCYRDIRTHEEARSLGVGVGVPVYGVPLKLSGNFDQQTREQFRRDHCQTTLTENTYRQSMYQAYAQASPIIVEAWSACMQRTGKIKIGCRIFEEGANAFSYVASYRPEHSGDLGPKVSYFGALNARCDALPVGARLGTATVKCHRTSPDLAAIVYLETEGSGECVRALPANTDLSCPRNFVGEVVLDANTRVACDKVTFKQNATVTVTEGATFQVLARNIIFEPNAKIVSIGKKGAPGDPGRRANNGCDKFEAPTHDVWNSARNVCLGKQGSDMGGDGGQGRPGLPGGQVTLSGLITGTASCVQRQGPGGDGGPGGCGKKLWCREHGDGHYHECNGDRGPTGDTGETVDCVYTAFPEDGIVTEKSNAETKPAIPNTSKPHNGCAGCSSSSNGNIAILVVLLLFRMRSRQLARRP